MERRRFTEEFKREEVRLARQPDASKASIAKDLGINPNILAHWAPEFEGKVSKVARGKTESISSEEFECMRRELVKVKTERDILKKALAISARLCPRTFPIHRDLLRGNSSLDRFTSEKSVVTDY